MKLPPLPPALGNLFNRVKAHWLALTVGLAYALLAGGLALYFIHAARGEAEAASAKLAEELKQAETALLHAKQEQGACVKEKALNAEFRRAQEAAAKEIASLRGSLETLTQAAAKDHKPDKPAQPARADRPPAPAKCPPPAPPALQPPPVCEEKGRDQLRALQALQAEIYRQEYELREKQRKLDEEKRKLDTQNTEYRWPRPAAQ